MADVVLEVDSVLHSYGERAILSDIYLKCVPGDIVGLFGRNGVGKTTLFNIIFGTLKAERSFVRINGNVLTGKAYRSGLISYLTQFDFLPRDFKVQTIVDLYVNDTSDFLEDNVLKKLSSCKVRDLSGGELRYLQIKLMLHSSAPFVILDEPFKGLSPIIIEEVRSQIITASQNKGIILSDHNFREVHKVSNRLMLLSDCYLSEIKNLEELLPYGYSLK